LVIPRESWVFRQEAHRIATPHGHASD
jgi:hypothetical protein